MSTDPPTLEASIVDSARMDNPRYVALDRPRGLALVAGVASNSIAVIDVSDPRDPVIAGVVVDAEFMWGPQARAAPTHLVPCHLASPPFP